MTRPETFTLHPLSYRDRDLSELDRSAIKRIRQEAPGLNYVQAKLLHDYRNKPSYNFCAEEHRFCEALEDRLARAKAERIIPLRADSNNDGHHQAPPQQANSARATPPPEQAGPQPPEQPPIAATPFRWRDPAKIPARKWLYGRHYARQFLTCTIASSGMGKTSLAIGEALAMASGKPLLGITPPERARVWIWNGEDPRDELDRRIEAAMLDYDLKPEDVEGYLFTDTGREMPIIIATQIRQAIIAKPVVEAVIATIKQNKIDVLVIDPFIKSHRVVENDNSAMDAVATEWAHIADVTNCAVELLHHTRKTGGNEVSVEDGRGAGAVVSASRSARTINRMSKDEAEKAGIDAKTAWRYLKVDSGKASMSSHPEHADWYRLVTVPLGNGDDVGVVVGWLWPDAFAGVTVHDLRAAQKAVSEDGPWRADIRAKMWVGKPIAGALKLNIKDKADRQKIKTLLETWTKTGMFVEVEGQDDERHPVTFVEVGTWAND